MQRDGRLACLQWKLIGKGKGRNRKSHRGTAGKLLWRWVRHLFLTARKVEMTALGTTVHYLIPVLCRFPLLHVPIYDFSAMFFSVLWTRSYLFLLPVFPLPAS